MERKQGILVSITGWSGSGKTTFITACITRLHKAGYRVYALKSTHMKLELDTPGTDSYRFREAGAEGVCLLTGGGTAVFLDEREEGIDRSRLSTLFPDADIILAEGYHGVSDLRFEAVLEGSRGGLKTDAAVLDGVITSTDIPPTFELPEGIAVFSQDDPDAFINRLEEEIRRL